MLAFDRASDRTITMASDHVSAAPNKKKEISKEHYGPRNDHNGNRSAYSSLVRFTAGSYGLHYWMKRASTVD